MRHRLQQAKLLGEVHTSVCTRTHTPSLSLPFFFLIADRRYVHVSLSRSAFVLSLCGVTLYLHTTDSDGSAEDSLSVVA